MSDELEIEVLYHSYDNQCRLCGHRGIKAMDAQVQRQYGGQMVVMQCQAKVKYDDGRSDQEVH